METELKLKKMNRPDEVDLNDLLKKTKNQHILEIYTEMTRNLRVLAKTYTDGNIYDTHTYHAIRYMEANYKETIDKFKNEDTLFEIDK